MNKNILLIGSQGYIGTVLTKYLLKKKIILLELIILFIIKKKLNSLIKDINLLIAI